jgi:anti-sigma B factor antagonist
MAYTLEHDPIDTGHLITLTGELDIAATPELSTVLLIAAGSPGPLVVLDLAGVEFIDSAGLGALLATRERAQDRGVGFTLSRTSDAVGRLLELTGAGVVLSG